MRINNQSSESERRLKQRRICKDRRAMVRFDDALGRRSGIDRRGSQPLKRFKDSLKFFMSGNV